MKQERECWEIGDLTFCASRWSEQGWLVYGMVGDAGMSIEVIEEEYIVGDLKAAREKSKEWAWHFANHNLQAAEDFTP